MKFRIEGMTDAEFRNLNIYYGFYDTPLGEMLIASTSRGICCIEFADNHVEALQLLCKRFSKSSLLLQHTAFHSMALQFFSEVAEDCSCEIIFHLYGTDFQIEVWGALLEIPVGKISTYSDVARAINKPRALRAVGTAIGRNPVAVLIPCHRVLRSDGGIGGYYWGIEKKKMILEWERIYKKRI